VTVEEKKLGGEKNQVNKKKKTEKEPRAPKGFSGWSVLGGVGKGAQKRGATGLGIIGGF